MPRFSTSSFVWRGIKQWSFTQNRLSSFVSRKTPKRRAGVSPYRVRRHDATAFCRCARALRLVQRCRRARLLRAFKRSKKKKKATRAHALLGEGDRSSSSEEDEKGQKSYLFLVFFTQNEILKIVSKKRGFKKKKKEIAQTKTHHEVHNRPATATNSRRREVKHIPRVSPHSPVSMDPGFVGIGLVQLS